ncbi:MAG: HAMP domain-containing protein, partial [Firmicutes bacterium]|nr:HAMP domain-containing protein [Bacillota bacterium]
MLKRISLKVKLIVLFLLVGLIPLAIVGMLSYNSAKDGIQEEVFKQLEMYSDLSKDTMDTYFEDIRHDANIMATTRDIYQSLNILAEAGYDMSDPAWLERIGIIDTLMAALAEDKGYDLVYLTNHEGVVIYSTNQGFMGDDISDRNYIQDALEGRTEWSQLFYSNITGTNVMTVGAPVFSAGRGGNVLGTLNISVDDRGIAQILHGGLGELGMTADAFLVNEDGLLFSNSRLGEHSHDAALKQSINTRAVELLAPAIRAGNTDFYAAAEYLDHQGDPVLEGLEVVQMGRLPMGLVVKIDQAEAFAGVTRLRNVLIPIIAVSAIAIAFVAFAVALTIIRPVQKVNNLTVKLAEGDFTTEAEVASEDEIGQMAQNINNTVQALRTTLQHVQAAADNVSHASDEISVGNQDLSQRTEEQASSLEEIASTIEEIASSLEASSAHSMEADNLSNRTLESVQRGENVVGEMQGAMSEITQGNQEIAEIIAKVNDIAFQTNLLALNAAVEAARAGEQGRGFAVVAAEVRNLAGHSAESAKEIEKLIKDSIVRVDKGNSLMDETEKVLQEIIENTQKTSDVVGEIASSLKEQSSAAGDIRSAVEELNQVTQQNASLVEEIASSSENMNSEAVELADQVSFFKLSSNDRVDGNGVLATRPRPEKNGKKKAKKAV